MAKRVQRIRYTGATIATTVGKDGELIINLSNRSVTVHDGATPGGFEQARADLSNAADATSSASGRMSAAHVIDLDAVIANLITETASRIAADALKADLLIPSAVNNVALLNIVGNLADSGKTMAQHLAGLIPAGTKMLFAQTAAPTGWTQDASNDRMLRVVSGAGAGVGGSLSPIISHTHTTPDHTLIISEIPAHTHIIDISSGETSGAIVPEATTDAPTATMASGSTGGGAAHNHGNTGTQSAPKYVDVIFATKD